MGVSFWLLVKDLGTLKIVGLVKLFPLDRVLIDCGFETLVHFF